MFRTRLKRYPLQLCIDSGAFTLFYKHLYSKTNKRRSSVGRKVSKSLTFADTEEFDLYRNKYVSYINNNSHLFSFYITLDVLHDAERSWNSYLKLRESGVQPVPVFHTGSPIHYLERYLKECDYIAIAGFSGKKRVIVSYLDRLFSNYIMKKGEVIKKVHGLAMTSSELIKRYPWYSVDSTSWGAASRYGAILMPEPIWKNNHVIGFSYMGSIYTLKVTNSTGHSSYHFMQLGDARIKIVNKYLQVFGESVSNYKTIENPTFRDYLNICYMRELEISLKQHYQTQWGYGDGGNVYLSGKTTETMRPEVLRRSLLRPVYKRYPGEPLKFMVNFFSMNQFRTLVKGCRYRL